MNLFVRTNLHLALALGRLLHRRAELDILVLLLHLLVDLLDEVRPLGSLTRFLAAGSLLASCHSYTSEQEINLKQAPKTIYRIGLADNQS